MNVTNIIWLTCVSVCLFICLLKTLLLTLLLFFFYALALPAIVAQCLCQTVKQIVEFKRSLFSSIHIHMYFNNIIIYILCLCLLFSSPYSSFKYEYLCTLKLYMCELMLAYVCVCLCVCKIYNILLFSSILNESCCCFVFNSLLC